MTPYYTVPAIDSDMEQPGLNGEQLPWKMVVWMSPLGEKNSPNSHRWGQARLWAPQTGRPQTLPRGGAWPGLAPRTARVQKNSCHVSVHRIYLNWMERPKTWTVQVRAVSRRKSALTSGVTCLPWIMHTVIWCTVANFGIYSMYPEQSHYLLLWFGVFLTLWF